MGKGWDVKSVGEMGIGKQENNEKSENHCVYRNYKSASTEIRAQDYCLSREGSSQLRCMNTAD